MNFLFNPRARTSYWDFIILYDVIFINYFIMGQSFLSWERSALVRILQQWEFTLINIPTLGLVLSLIPDSDSVID